MAPIISRVVEIIEVDIPIATDENTIEVEGVVAHAFGVEFLEGLHCSSFKNFWHIGRRFNEECLMRQFKGEVECARGCAGGYELGYAVTH